MSSYTVNNLLQIKKELYSWELWVYMPTIFKYLVYLFTSPSDASRFLWLQKNIPLWLYHLPCLSAPFNTDFSSSNIANMGGLHLTFSFLYHCLLWYAYSKHYFRFNGMFHVVAFAMVMEIFCSLQTIGILHYCPFIWRRTTATMVLWPMPVLFLWYTT